MNNILFVCMGNICRSPTAKGFFDLHCRNRGLENVYGSESAGTHGWHVGQPPDPRSISAAAAWNVDISEDLSQQVGYEDFHRFDHILAMDNSNLGHLNTLDPGTGTARLSLLLSFGEATGGSDVPDPYFGGDAGFDTVCRILDQACSDFLDHLENIRQKSGLP